MNIASLLNRFVRDQRGNMAMIFGLSMIGILSATGAGIDLSRAYQARQKLSEVANLTCQYASRPSIVQMADSAYVAPSGGPTYMSAVTGYLNSALTAQKVNWTQTQSSPFTYTAGGPADVRLGANVPTVIMKIVGVTQMPVAASTRCYDSTSSVPPIVPDGSDPYVIREGFENATCGGTCFEFFPIPTRPYLAVTNTFINSVTYTGNYGVTWYAMGYCLETDSAGTIKATVAEGGKSAELDCDNGSNSKGNSSISTRAYFAVGNYELRFNYVSRVNYPNYNPTYLCGSQASDLSWANDSNSQGGPVANAVRTNQMNVYFDREVSGAPPTHTTLYDNQTLAGSNMIDTCVYAQNWIERSVRLTVSTPGYYWVSFAADGQNDSFGAQLDDVRVCQETCPGNLDDNFPSSWLPVASVNKQLFRDSFESPAPSCTGCIFADTNLALYNGNTGTSSSGWPNQTASGWGVAPYNKNEMLFSGSKDGTQSLDMDNSAVSGWSTSNRSLSRPLLLDPGYYRIDYNYAPSVLLPSVTTTTCVTAPSTSSVLSSFTDTTVVPYTIRYTSSGSGTAARDTNTVGVFMGHSDLISTPVIGTTYNTQTSFNNPGGTTSTTPTADPVALNFSTFNGTQSNALLDICKYAPSWQDRSVNVKIVKPGNYWMFFAGLRTADNIGGTLDDVRVTALGSLYMASPPSASATVTIPVPNPQPDTVTNFTGFRIVSNPLTPPAVAQ